MQKVSFPNISGSILKGCYYSADSDAGVVIAHGSASNKDREKLAALSEGLIRQGIPVLRFDCRGAGESGRGAVTVRGYYEDLCSARAFMYAQGHRNQGLMGASLGGLTVLKAYDELVRAMALWAPVTAAKKPGILHGKEEELRQRGYLAKRKDGRFFRFPQQYFDERQAVNQKELCSKIGCPVLIIHGDKDEAVPLEHSRSAMQYFSRDSKLIVVKGGTHSLEESIGRIVPKTVEWFKRHLY